MMLTFGVQNVALLEFTQIVVKSINNGEIYVVAKIHVGADEKQNINI